jgi:hypothetical protein
MVDCGTLRCDKCLGAWGGDRADRKDGAEEPAV